MASVVPIKVRRETSDINRLQRVDDVSPAPFVADAGAFAGYVQIHDEPVVERSRLQHAMAGREVHVAIAQIVDILEEAAGAPLGVFVIRQYQPALVPVENLG